MYRDLGSQLNELDQYKADVIVDLAGKDSFAAIIRYLEDSSTFPLKLLPVVVKSPTEYGPDEQFINSFNNLRDKLLKTYDIRFSSVLFIEEPLLWHYLNGRFVANTIDNYNFYSPCPACHIYIHSIRAFVAQKLGINKIISGERLSHGSKVKLNQLDVSIKYHSELLEKLNVTHLQPIKGISDDTIINDLINKYVDVNSIHHFRCVFSSNYRETDGTVAIPSKLDAYYKLCIKIALKYFQVFQLSENEIEKEMLELVINETSA
jgi:hypothetical protein